MPSRTDCRENKAIVESLVVVESESRAWILGRGTGYTLEKMAR
jgi:hypothetical protein